MPLDTLLADVAVKATVLLLAACVAAVMPRRASAAARHLLWSITVVGLLLLLVLAALLPAWRILPDPFGIAKPSVPQPDREQPAFANDADLAPLAPPQDLAASSNDALPIERESNTTQVGRPIQPVPVSNDDRTQPDRASRFGFAASLWIVSIWLAGVVLGMGRLCLAMLQLRRLRMRATPIGDPAWTSLLGRLGAQIGRRHPVPLFECDRPCVPMTFGLLHPSILLPPSAAQWSAERRRVVLLHELAHVQRRDCLTHLLGQVAAALYWFHPLAWLAVRRLGVERERACDDLVLACGTEPCAYAEHVVELAAGLPSGSLAAAALAMARRSALEGRLRAILDLHVNRRNPGRLSMTLSMIALCAVVFPLAPLGRIRPSAAGAPPREPSATQKEDPSPFDRLDRSPIPPYELAAAGSGDPAAAPAELVAVLGDSRLNHWSNVQSLAFNQEGTVLVSASSDHTVMLWDAATGQALRTLKGHALWVEAVAVTPDGRRIASASVDKTVRIWDAKTGKLLHTLPHADPLTSLAVSPDGQLVAVPDNSALKLWSLTSGKLVRSWATNQHTLVAFHPQGTMVATAEHRELTVWDVETGGALRVFEMPRDVYAATISVAFSPAGQLVALGSQRGIALWEADTGQLVQTIAATGSFFCFSPDGGKIATGWDRSGVRVWDVATGAELVTVNVVRPAYCAAFSPDGQTLATGAGNTIQLWDSATGEERTELRQPIGDTLAVAVSRDGTTIAAASRGDAPVINLWDVASRRVRRQLFGHSNEIHNLALSPDGTLLASVSHMRDGTFKVWDFETGKTLWTRFPEDERIGGFAFDSTGKTLLCTVDGKLQRRAVTTGEPLPFARVDDDYRRSGVWLSADGTRFATIAHVDTQELPQLAPRLEVWDVAQQRRVGSFGPLQSQPGRATFIGQVALNRDGTQVSAAVYDAVASGRRGLMREGARRMIMQWDVGTGDEQTRDVEGTDQFDAFLLSPDGRTLAASASDGVVYLFDARSLEPKRTLRLGPSGAHLGDIAFAPDGGHLVTANGNGTLYVLRLKP